MPSLTAGAVDETIHDFFGFPKELYDIRYPAPGSPWRVDRAAALIEGAGGAVGRAPARGLDSAPRELTCRLPRRRSRRDLVGFTTGI